MVKIPITCFFILVAFSSIVRAEDTVCSLKDEKQYPLTPFWIPVEGTLDLDLKMEEVYLNGTKDTELKMCDTSLKNPLVANVTAEVFEIMGIGKTEDGKMYIFDKDHKCFGEIDAVKYPWGMGKDVVLAVFSSIGMKNVKIGTVVFIKELKDVKLPDGKVHNGCVRVDESCDDCLPCGEIILHIGYYSNTKVFRLPQKVSAIENEKCEILKYE